MDDESYLQWLSGTTGTAWWHDSGDPGELRHGLEHGAVGVTTNPVLCAQALKNNSELWREDIQSVMAVEASPSARAESLMRIVVVSAARALEPIHRSTQGAQGYVCAQVDPSLAGNRAGMQAMGMRLAAWGPNIAVKLPATSAGLDVMERLCADGIAVTVTVSFTVAQACAIAERYQRVVSGHEGRGRVGRCFAVMMIGRLDDYLREVCADNESPLAEQEIQSAGLSVVKNAYRLYREKRFAATLLVAALRGNYHMTGLAGGNLIMSIHPTCQKSLLAGPAVREKLIDEPIPSAVQEKLLSVPEFMRAFEPNGLSEKEMISFGLTQRTLAQFTDGGWKLLEQFQRKG
jgi:transaldolase